jgi:F-type H+-transporting ATPase subunit gamma
MTSSRDIKGKIRSIESTKQITKAMEMVSASKMKKANALMNSSSPYANHIRSIISHLLSMNPEYKPQLMVPRKTKAVGYLVVSSKRGLCGGLNNNLFKNVLEHINSHEENVTVKLCTVGSKAVSFFNQLDIESLAALELEADIPDLSEILGIIGIVLHAFTSGEIDKLYVCSNQFVNTMVQKPHIEQLLPLTWAAEEKRVGDYLYEPRAEEILERLLMRYAEGLIYQALVENYTCEQAARMMAMKSATENATDLIEEFKLIYNKARQAAITKEISEIVGGAAAL